MKLFDFLFDRETEIAPAENPENKPENKPEERQQKPSAQEWRYGVAGNITKTHYDAQGVLRYGSSAFCGGAKAKGCDRAGVRAVPSGCLKNDDVRKSTIERKSVLWRGIMVSASWKTS